MKAKDKPFWQVKSLDQMDPDEWESLCDHCVRCCLHKLENKDSGDVYFTDVACRYLDEEECTCKNYEERQSLANNCLVIKPDWEQNFNWLPSTCAYRLINDNKELPDWHPLVSGEKNTVHLAGISVRGRTFRDNEVAEEQLIEHLITWVN